MYITVKDTANLPTVGRNDFIDNLFSGIEVDTLPAITYTEESLIRTKTYKIDEVQTDIISEDRFRLAMEHIMQTIKDIQPVEHYKEFKIPKKTHGFRTINAPDDILKPKMTKVAKILSDELQILAHDSAWAYVKGRDVITAMKEHQKNNSRWFLKLDLKDFFGSCSVDFIVQQLEKIYPFAVYPSTMPEVIANFATLNGGLPQGTPLSPMLTNLIMVEIDYKINRLIYDLTQEAGLFKQSYVYTRYADDIIISAKNNFKYDIIIEAIDNLLEDTPLTINREKVRYGSSSGRNWNLGIMYNKDNELTIGYREKQKLKVTIYNYIHDGLWPLEDLRWLLGKLNWLHNVQPGYFEGLMNYYKNKYNVDVIKNIISDIKTYNN